MKIRYRDCEHEIYWYAAPNNEDGWRCCFCDRKPGEPPGYDPQRDREDIGRKVGCVLHDLADHEIVSISNGSHADYVTNFVAERCRELGRFDSLTIASEILATETPSHAEYWQRIGDAVLAGNDPRDRCPCGELAVSHSLVGGGEWQHRCSRCWRADIEQERDHA